MKFLILIAQPWLRSLISAHDLYYQASLRGSKTIQDDVTKCVESVITLWGQAFGNFESITSGFSVSSVWNGLTKSSLFAWRDLTNTNFYLVQTVVEMTTFKYEHKPRRIYLRFQSQLQKDAYEWSREWDLPSHARIWRNTKVSRVILEWFPHSKFKTKVLVES